MKTHRFAPKKTPISRLVFAIIYFLSFRPEGEITLVAHLCCSRYVISPSGRNDKMVKLMNQLTLIPENQFSVKGIQ